jgi:polysaccharide export outer membrane protein
VKYLSHPFSLWLLLSLICGLFSLPLHAEEDKNASYRLGSGDKLKITIFNQEDLNGEYVIDGAGNFSLPLVGTIAAKNVTLEELEKKLKDALSPDFLLNPQISIQVLNYRPFYILGEVEKPDSYPYVSGMTYRNAVAIAGGFTYRAKEDHVYVIHGNDPSQKEIKAKMDMQVLPGDIIRVDERMF